MGAGTVTHEEEYTTTGIPHDKMGMWVFLCSEVMFFTGLIGVLHRAAVRDAALAAAGRRS